MGRCTRFTEAGTLRTEELVAEQTLDSMNRIFRINSRPGHPRFEKMLASTTFQYNQSRPTHL